MIGSTRIIRTELTRHLENNDGPIHSYVFAQFTDAMLKGQNLLITGGAGYVGRLLTEHFLDRNPNVVRVVDNHEPSLADMKGEFDDGRLRFLSGDTRDKARLDRMMENIDVVVHTAAMKHVDICEYNPFEAVKTNTMGLQNIIDASIDANVSRVVFTSSDKAVNPTNTMGTTKLLAEKLITAGNKYKGDRDLRLASVRFGNVINSSQSVVPLFNRQIEDGGPITLTAEGMTRFFLKSEDLTALVENAIAKTNGGEVFIRKMPAVNIGDLARAMRETLAPKFGYAPEDIEIDLTGSRVGETYHEEIMTEREATRAMENESLYVIPPETSAANGHLDYDGIEGFEPAENIVRSSAMARLLDHDGIVSLLRANGIIDEVA